MGFMPPNDDASNDINLLEEESFFDPDTGEWKVVFWRRLNTGDESDKTFFCGFNAIALGRGVNHENT